MTGKNVRNRKKNKLPEMRTESTLTSNKLELLVTIVGRKKAEYYADLIQSLEVNMQAVAFGHGTADAKMLVYLGLADSEKAVIFSVIQENKIPQAMQLLD